MCVCVCCEALVSREQTGGQRLGGGVGDEKSQTWSEFSALSFSPTAAVSCRILIQPRHESGGAFSEANSDIVKIVVVMAGTDWRT